MTRFTQLQLAEGGELSWRQELGEVEALVALGHRSGRASVSMRSRMIGRLGREFQGAADQDPIGQPDRVPFQRLDTLRSTA